MTVRQQIALTFQVGQDASLDEKIFDANIEALLDTCEHAEAGVYTLEENENNVSVDFGDVTEARAIWIESSGDLEVVIGGIPGTVGTLLGSGGTFPTAFAGGEAFSFRIDGTAVTGTFLDADETLQQVVNRLNSTAMLAGLDFVPFKIEGGQIRVSGKLATSVGEVEVLVANATIGFPATTSDNGTDASGSAAPQQIRKPIDEDANSDGPAFYFATVKTTSLILANLASSTTTVRVCIVGDITT